jgi:DNA-binding HxlR family transcriptional regulator
MLWTVVSASSPAQRVRRAYEQYCPAARALEIVGERWSLLIVRELALGPKRFTDLEAGLPAIRAKVLAERLRSLRESGVIGRTELPPPLASTVYELTPLGEQLRPALDELTRWGLNFLGAPRPHDRLRISWLMRALEGSFRPDAAQGLQESYEFTIDGETFHLRVAGEVTEVRDGPAVSADFRYSSDLWTFVAIGARLIDPAEAVVKGLASVSGDLQAGLRSIEIFGPHLDRSGPSEGLPGMIALRLRPPADTHLREEYEIHVGEEILHVQVDGGRAKVSDGPALHPAVTFTTDLTTLLAIGVHRVSPEEATASGSLRIEGEQQAVARALNVLDIRRDPSD